MAFRTNQSPALVAAQTALMSAGYSKASRHPSTALSRLAVDYLEETATFCGVHMYDSARAHDSIVHMLESAGIRVGHMVNHFNTLRGAN